MNIRPLPGFVLVSPIEDEVKTSGGLYVPENDKDKPSRGRVVAVSPLVPMNYRDFFLTDHKSTATKEYSKVKVNEVVIYKKYTNQEIEHEGKKYLLVNFSELLAIIE